MSNLLSVEIVIDFINLMGSNHRWKTRSGRSIFIIKIDGNYIHFKPVNHNRKGTTITLVDLKDFIRIWYNVGPDVQSKAYRNERNGNGRGVSYVPIVLDECANHYDIKHEIPYQENESVKGNSSKITKFNNEMLDLYHVVGKATGYWANYYLRSVRKIGGLAHAKKALAKEEKTQDGFKKLIEVGRPDLSLEASVISEEYRELFTKSELEEAERRLSSVPEWAWRKRVEAENNFSGEIEKTELFKEGATKQVTVNSYERNSAARKECLKKFGYNCQVCNMSFSHTYGDIGKSFIHVHHLKPLAGVTGEYELNPGKDLVPVCPNCHAMLHASNPPLSIAELKELIIKSKDNQAFERTP